MNFDKIFGIIISGLVFNNKRFQALLTAKISADSLVLVAAQELDRINPAPNGTTIDGLLDLASFYIDLGPGLTEAQRDKFKKATKAITTNPDEAIDAAIDNFFDKVLDAGASSVSITTFVNANLPAGEAPIPE